MSMSGHLNELMRKHESLDQRIAKALAHPSPDDASVIEMKRKKLALKDEIARLQAGASGQAGRLGVERRSPSPGGG
jgi:hypothetical protein